MSRDSSAERLSAVVAALARIAADGADVAVLMQRAADEVMHITGGNGAVVEQADADEMIYLAVAGSIAPYIGLRLPRCGSLSGLCVDSRQAQRCDDSETDPRVHREACRRIGARSMLIVPLLFGDSVLGVLKVTAAVAGGFDAVDQQVLELCAPVIAAALGRELRLQQGRDRAAQLDADLANARAAEATWRNESLTDALTGLANRRQFEAWIEQACAPNSTATGMSALCFIDVNQFKQINDRHGHDVGDQALRLVARVLRDAARDSDRVARLAGDEFVVLLQPLIDPALQAEWFARKALSALGHERLTLGGQALAVSISIGIAVHSGPGLDRAAWLAQADAAMYCAKLAGGGRYHVYTDTRPAAGHG